MAISIKDLARESGLSTSTISLALRDSPRVKATTRHRVQTLAQEMGYRPDPSMAHLASRRWARDRAARQSPLGLILHGEKGSQLVGAPKALLEPTREVVKARGFRLIEHYLGDRSEAKEVAESLRAEGVRGLFVMPVLDPDQRVMEAFDFAHFTPIALGRGRYPLPLHTVSFNHFDAMRQCLNEAWRRGYRHIGVAPFAHRPWSFDDSRTLGAATAELFTGRVTESDVAQHFFCGPHEDREGFLKWAFNGHFDAVVIFSGSYYHWLKEEADARGTACPGCVTLHAHPGSPVTGTNMSHEDLLTCALSHLESLMRNNEWGIPRQRHTHLIDALWHEGGTLPALPEVVTEDIPPPSGNVYAKRLSLDIGSFRNE